MSKFSKTLTIHSSPHIGAVSSVDSIMFNVVLALLPVCAFAVYAFGLSALLVLLTALLSCVVTEHLLCRLSGQQTTVGDWSVVITGLLYGLILPPSLPLWMVAAGGVIGVGVGKFLFGGLGYNTFNPALIGRAILQAAFPAAMTTWPESPSNPFTSLHSSTLAWPLTKPRYDGVSGATPLSNCDRHGRPVHGIRCRIDRRNLCPVDLDRWSLFGGSADDELENPGRDSDHGCTLQQCPAYGGSGSLRRSDVHAVFGRIDAGRSLHGHRHGCIADHASWLRRLRHPNRSTYRDDSCLGRYARRSHVCDLAWQCGVATH